GVISADGTVTRPVDEDKTVTLTANFSMPGTQFKQEKEFTVTVKRKIDLGWTDSDVVAYDKSMLTVAENDWVTNDFPIPSFGEKGSIIKWESDNAAIQILPGTAKVTVTPGQAPQVTLTATITSGTVTDTKTFVLSILANMNQGRPITASNTHSAGFKPDMAVDGNRESTRWATNAGASQWMRVDYGEEKFINLVEVYDYKGISKELTLQGSHNDSEWEPIIVKPFDIKEVSGAVRMTIELPKAVKYRYLKLAVTKSSAQPSIFEFEAYYQPDSEVLKDLASLTESTVTNGSLSDLTGTTNPLPTVGENGTAIKWTSSNENVLSLAVSGDKIIGTVHRPEGVDHTVRLTAFLSKDGNNDRIKTYIITVKGTRAGRFYTVDENFNKTEIPKNVWDGDATLEKDMMKAKLGAQPSRLYPLTKSAEAKDNFILDMDVSPEENSTGVEFSILTATQEVQSRIHLQKESDGSWSLNFGGKTASNITKNDNGKFHMKIETIQGGKVMNVHCNGVVLGAEALSDGVGIHSIGMRAVNGSSTLLLDNITASVETDKILDIVAAGLTPAGFTAENPDRITKNLTFNPQVMDGISSSWKSSNESVISET
ncbi:MAG: discoidin domain-containing protein, partial [Acinetobacter sp.]